MEDQVEALWWSRPEFCEEGWSMQNGEPGVDMGKVDVDPDVSESPRRIYK
jgi:hypothetical protein